MFSIHAIHYIILRCVLNTGTIHYCVLNNITLCSQYMQFRYHAHQFIEFYVHLSDLIILQKKMHFSCMDRVFAHQRPNKEDCAVQLEYKWTWTRRHQTVKQDNAFQKWGNTTCRMHKILVGRKMYRYQLRRFDWGRARSYVQDVIK